MGNLLTDIDAFLARNAVAESTFGREAVNDWQFVRSLRNGRRVWPETAARVRKFMNDFEAVKTAHSTETQGMRDSSRIYAA